MKYIKLYENIEEDPQIGDYVIMKDRLPALLVNDSTIQLQLLIFIKNNIGKIIDIFDQDNVNYVIVEYDNIPDDIPDEMYDVFTTDFPTHLKQNLLIFNLKHIKMFDKDKENLEARMSANKYNL